jgi:hypothetical protein
MTEYVNVRASETLNQGELVAFLKTRFSQIAKPIGRAVVEGTECVEVRVPSESAEFEEIREFIDTRRRQGLHGYSDFTIGHYLRKYTKAELRQAEVLRLNIIAHFEPSGLTFLPWRMPMGFIWRTDGSPFSRNRDAFLLLTRLGWEMFSKSDWGLWGWFHELLA